MQSSLHVSNVLFSLLSQSPHNLKVVGSNPAPATTKNINRIGIYSPLTPTRQLASSFEIEARPFGEKC